MPQNDRDVLPEITAEELVAIRARAVARRATENEGGRVQDSARVQLNVRIGAGLKGRLLAQARASNSDIGTIVTAALEAYMMWRRVP